MMQQTPWSPRPLATVVEPCLRPASAADRDALGEFIAGLSPESAYSRFLTGLPGEPSARVLAALLPEPPAGGAVLGFLDGELVGHGLWVRLADSSVAEIAIVVGDRHQRRGIGTALVNAVIDDLLEHGVTDLEVFSISGNRAVARMVARAAPDARRELDGPTTTWTFPVGVRSGTLSRTA
jgi:GNAT superfamily N-acetyltransferase